MSFKRGQSSSADDDDFELLDVEGYSSGGKSGFSYPDLVAFATRKCIDHGTKEMMEGYFNLKTDKLGNTMKIWVPDTRLQFIESVETLKMLLEREYDSETTKKMNELNLKIERTFNNHYNFYKNEYNLQPAVIKVHLKKKGIFFKEGVLPQKSEQYTDYLNEKVSIYREIFSTLYKLLKELNDFKEETFEA